MSSNLETSPRTWMQARAVAEAEARRQRHLAFGEQRRRGDVWVAFSALAVALLLLPSAPSLQSPEICSILAVAAVALVAGQRWAIALVVLAELLLLPTAVPRALGGLSDGVLLQLPDPDLAAAAQLAAIGSLIMMVPGLRASRRAAAALVLITGLRRSRTSCRAAHALVWASGITFALLTLG